MEAPLLSGKGRDSADMGPAAARTVGRVAAQGDLRPMAQSRQAMDDLKAILKSREPLYAKAHAALDTSGLPLDTAAAELAAIAVLLPVLVLLSRVEDRGRSALLAALLGTWLAAVALVPAMHGGPAVAFEMPDFSEFLSRNPPPPAHPRNAATAEQPARGTIRSDLHERGRGRMIQKLNAAMDGLEALVLAHACAGIDVASPAYVEGIETAVDAIGNAIS